MAYRKRTKDMNLTPTQEHMLQALWMLEKAEKKTEPPDETCSYSGSAIALVMGGRWSDYRARQMLDLEENGWLILRRVDRLVFYHLTETAHGWFTELLNSARSGRKMMSDPSGESVLF